jgi:hypothetical protein
MLNAMTDSTGFCAFTVSHSITLTAATLGYVHMPEVPIVSQRSAETAKTR